MNEYREQLDEARAKGLEQRHQFRLEMAVRREVSEEIAKALEAVDGVDWALAGQQAGLDAARIVREIGARQ